MPRYHPYYTTENGSPYYDNEGQERYAYEQEMLGRVRRGEPTEHPIPSPDYVPSPDHDQELDNDYGEWGTITDDQLANIRDVALETEESMAPPPKKQKSTNKTAPGINDATQPTPGTSAAGAGAVAAGDNMPEGMELTIEQDANEVQNNKGQPGATAAIYHLARPIRTDNVYRKTFVKCHKFFTFGLAWVPITKDIAAVANVNNLHKAYFMTSSLAEVPVHKLALYMDPSEFNLLHPGTYVESIHVEVFQRNAVMQFETGGTSTNLATLNQNKNGIYAKGLNMSGYGCSMFFDGFDTGSTPPQPMKPTSVALPIYVAGDAPANTYEGLSADLYGFPTQTNTGTFNFTNSTPKHNFGQWTTLKNYWTTHQYSTDGSNGGWPSIQPYLNEWDATDAIGMSVCKYSYKPRLAPIKETLKHIYTCLPNDFTRFINHGHGYGGPETMEIKQPTTTGPQAINVWTHDLLQEGRNAIPAIPGPFPVAAQTTRVNQIESSQVRPQAGLVYDIDQTIEKSQFLQQGWAGSSHGQVQPSLHIGVMPAVSLTTASFFNTNSSFTDLRAYFDVKCTMTVAWREHTDRSHATEFNVAAGSQITYNQGIINALNGTISEQAYPNTKGGTYGSLLMSNQVKIA